MYMYIDMKISIQVKRLAMILSYQQHHNQGTHWQVHQQPGRHRSVDSKTLYCAVHTRSSDRSN